MVQSCDAIVVGAGPAGLATAAALRARGLDAAILEKSDAVGAVWRRHYDRLHLHTDRARSGLPGLPIPKAYGRYPSRAQVVEYLEHYAAKFDLKPIFNAPSSRAAARRGRVARRCRRELTNSADRRRRDRLGRLPVRADMARHRDVRRGDPAFESLSQSCALSPGERVLVVGSGNSGAEIALDLAETGIDVALSVRSPVNVIPRELFGLPILVFPTAEQWLPPRLADAINAPLLRYAIGSIEKLGLKRAAKGPLQSIAEDGRVPLIDVGTLDAIRDGRIKLRGDVAYFSRENVGFRQSPAERFDAIILATGFRPDLRSLLPDAKDVLGATGAPLVSGRATAEPGLFFCGAIPSAIGQFRQIGIEARSIADSAARSLSAAVLREAISLEARAQPAARVTSSF